MYIVCYVNKSFLEQYDGKGYSPRIGTLASVKIKILIICSTSKVICNLGKKKTIFMG